MQRSPTKPRRIPLSQASDNEDGFSDDGGYVSRDRKGRDRSSSPPPTPPNRGGRSKSLLDDEAETTVGVSVKMKGDLSFERLLRIDGEFDGKLISKGSLIIGPKGSLIGDVVKMKEVVIDGGRIVGNIQVDRLTVRSKGQVRGDITAKVMKIDPGCIIMGQINVNPMAPEKINLKGEVVDENGKKKEDTSDDDDASP